MNISNIYQLTEFIFTFYNIYTIFCLYLTNIYSIKYCTFNQQHQVKVTDYLPQTLNFFSLYLCNLWYFKLWHIKGFHSQVVKIKEFKLEARSIVSLLIIKDILYNIILIIIHLEFKEIKRCQIEYLFCSRVFASNSKDFIYKDQ